MQNKRIKKKIAKINFCKSPVWHGAKIKTKDVRVQTYRGEICDWGLAVRKQYVDEKDAKNEEIDAIYQKSLARLKELANKEYPDEEEDHGEADDILCNMLNALGYKDLTDAWDDIKKRFS